MTKQNQVLFVNKRNNKSNNGLLTRGFDLVTPRFKLVTRGFDLVTPRFKLVTRGFGLVTRVLLFHYYPDP